MATIDLGELRDIEAVRGGFLQDQKSWIWLPDEMIVKTSVDGKKFDFLGVARPELDRKEEGVHLAKLEVKRATKARYVQISATSIARCPEWHTSAGEKAWIFADEIEIDLKK